MNSVVYKFNLNISLMQEAAPGPGPTAFYSVKVTDNPTPIYNLADFLPSNHPPLVFKSPFPRLYSVGGDNGSFITLDVSSPTAASGVVSATVDFQPDAGYWAEIEVQGYTSSVSLKNFHVSLDGDPDAKVDKSGSSPGQSVATPDGFNCSLNYDRFLVLLKASRSYHLAAIVDGSSGDYARALVTLRRTVAPPSPPQGLRVQGAN